MNEVVSITTMLLIVLALTSITHAVVMGLIKEPSMPDIRSLPLVLEGSYNLQPVEGGTKISVSLVLSTCEGTADSYVHIIGTCGGKRLLLSAVKPYSCIDSTLKAEAILEDTPCDGYKAYLWKFGQKSNEVNLKYVEAIND